MKEEDNLSAIVKFLFWPLLILALIIIYSLSFKNFFFGDDFFNLKLSQTKNPKEVLGFFNILKSPANFPFYRPLTTQLFFWTGFNLFKLNPFGYHIINFFFFLFSIFLVFVLAKKITKNETLSFLTTFFYAISGSHFYRLYFLSQFQEFGLAVFYFLTMIFYLKFIKEKKNLFKVLSLCFFILTLMAKESAITLPVSIVLLYLFKEKKTNFKSLKLMFFDTLPFYIILLIYLSLRIGFFGFAKGGDYQFVFNLKTTINSLLWYFLWSIGLPEHFVNLPFFKLPTIVNLKYFTDFGEHGLKTSFLLAVFIFCLFLGVKLFIKAVKKNNKHKDLMLISTSLSLTILTLLPVLFFPFHKFAYSTTLPLFGVSIFLAILAREIFKFSNVFFLIFITSFLFGSYNSLKYAYDSHWSVKRAQRAKKIVNYFRTHYSRAKESDSFYFHDAACLYCCQKTPAWSKEISYILSEGRGLELFFQKNFSVYFQEFTDIYEID